MSKDLKLFKICDHRVVEEEVQIDEDRRTIRIPRTLASQRVNLWINGFEFERDNSLNPWNIEADERSTITKRSKIVFRKKRKSLDDFFQISYFVESRFCPKCFGLRILNDPSYSKLGFAAMVTNEEKLLQEVKKGLTTELGSNAFHEWIGTLIHKLVGTKIFNTDALRSQVVQEVSQYLEKYLDSQTQQARYQEVTDRESFLQTLAIDMVQELETDPTLWTLTVIFQNRTGADMVFEKTVQIPGPSNLLYGVT
jgi:hypothetical protein